MNIETLSEAELTGEWEYKLSQIEKGQLSRKDFMKEIGELTCSIVDRAKSYGADTVPLSNPATLKAPVRSAAGRLSKTTDALRAPHATTAFPNIRAAELLHRKK